jgi:formamidopyrimidine-DNA glycosylase
MPELPEVETTVRGIKKHIVNQYVKDIIVRAPRLRWPVAPNIPNVMKNQRILAATRRGKYILIHIQTGTLIIHLGMSGSLRIVTPSTPPGKHDHVDMVFDEYILRFNDPRRFGACIFTEDFKNHPLLKKLGVEPLSTKFTKTYLWEKIQKRNVPIKSLIMNHEIVVGVGNIYATEALFAAKIHPQKIAKKLSKKECELLTAEIKKVLKTAIKAGGTTLKDFVNSDGKPGYFKLKLKVYGRAGLPCVRCQKKLSNMRLGQRSTVFCGYCQK